MNPITNLARDLRGTALVEFAMTIPLLLTLLFGGVELSRFIALHTKLQSVVTSVGDLVTREETLAASRRSGPAKPLSSSRPFISMNPYCRGLSRPPLFARSGSSGRASAACRICSSRGSIGTSLPGPIRPARGASGGQCPSAAPRGQTRHSQTLYSKTIFVVVRAEIAASRGFLRFTKASKTGLSLPWQ